MTPTVRSLHNEAMHYAQEALLARDNGDPAMAQDLNRKALPWELDAIRLLERDGADDPKLEPTRGILYLSAASLAFGSGDTPEAIRLARQGLSGNPDARTRHELTDIIREDQP